MAVNYCGKSFITLTLGLQLNQWGGGGCYYYSGCGFMPSANVIKHIPRPNFICECSWIGYWIVSTRWTYSLLTLFD